MMDNQSRLENDLKYKFVELISSSTNNWILNISIAW